MTSGSRSGLWPNREQNARFWDQYFGDLAGSGADLDWEGLWTDPFLGPLRQARARTVLELGCGTGNDAARLAREGYLVAAADLSERAVTRARARFGTVVSFILADLTDPLPFADASFDAAMSNVSMHMFGDRGTRLAFAEVGRVVRPGGPFGFHVNALEDRPLRARWRPVLSELEPDYVLESSGQTMHFFSEDYLRELLADWSGLRLDRLVIGHRETGEPFKVVWRGLAER